VRTNQRTIYQESDRGCTGYQSQLGRIGAQREVHGGDRDRKRCTGRRQVMRCAQDARKPCKLIRHEIE
jgi:hypothetical protein